MSNTALLLVTLEHFLFLQRSIPQIPFVQHSKESVWIEELIWILQISSECMVSSVHLQEITPGSSLPCLAQLLLTNWDSPRKCVICVAIWVDLSKTKGPHMNILQCLPTICCSSTLYQVLGACWTSQGKIRVLKLLTVGRGDANKQTTCISVQPHG